MEKCPFCKEKIQNGAVVCKYCKKDIPREKTKYELAQEKAKEKEDQYLATLSEDDKKKYLHHQKLKLMAFGIIVFAVVIIIFAWAISGCEELLTTSSSSSSKVDSVDAYSCAKEKVLEALKSPSSADFPSVFSGDIKFNQSGDSWAVDSYVDAQNSFGASLRSTFSCNLTIPDRDSCSGHCTIY